MESVGFKEWAIVCEALGQGEQTILLRKGGIAEGRDGFGFRHPEFFLFPTFFHEQIPKVRRGGAQIPKAREGEIEIRYFARLILATHVIAWETAAALEPFHILEESVVRERFEYENQLGLHVALVRVFRLAQAWTFPDTPRFGGCRSWVELPEFSAETRFEAVSTDAEHEERLKRFVRLTATGSPG